MSRLPAGHFLFKHRLSPCLFSAQHIKQSITFSATQACEKHRELFNEKRTTFPIFHML
jgi:hypothetical protein